MKRISVSTLQDSDGDGIRDPEDNCPSIPNPDQTDEDEDGAGADCDCDDSDPLIIEGFLYFQDLDDDGHGNPANSVRACTEPEGYVSFNDDCNDADPDIYPGAPALADGKDNDCDGIIDRASQTIDFMDIPDQEADVGMITLIAISSSGLPVTFSLEQGSGSIQENILYVNAAGQVSLTAHQDGNEAYLSADPITQSFCVNPLKPEISAAFVDGQPILISSSERDNQWFINGALLVHEVNDTLHVEDTGNYTVQVVTDQCYSAMSELFFMEHTAVESQAVGRILAYPNPTDGMIHFELPRHVKENELTFNLLDPGGRYIYRSRPLAPSGAGLISIDLGSLEPGVYYYGFSDGTGTIRFRGKILVR